MVLSAALCVYGIEVDTKYRNPSGINFAWNTIFHTDSDFAYATAKSY